MLLIRKTVMYIDQITMNSLPWIAMQSGSICARTCVCHVIVGKTKFLYQQFGWDNLQINPFFMCEYVDITFDACLLGQNDNKAFYWRVRVLKDHIDHQMANRFSVGFTV